MKVSKETMPAVRLGLLTYVAALAGCGGGMQPISPAPTPTPRPQTSRFLYVVDSIQNSVSGFSINAQSGVLTSVGADVPTDEAPLYAAATPDGRFLYVANANTDASDVSAYRIDPQTGVLTPTIPATFSITGDTDPVGIAVDPTSTHVYTANQGSVSAFNIDIARGALTDVAGTPVRADSNAQLESLAVSPDGRYLYATDSGNNVVRMYTLSSTGLPVAMGTVASADFPVGIAVDASGKFVFVANWIADSVSVYAITPGTGMLVAAGAAASVGTGCEPQELAVNPSSEVLYVTCAGRSTIAEFAIDRGNGRLTTMMPAFPLGAGIGPRGIAVDASGKFVYTAWNTQNRASAEVAGVDGALAQILASAATGRGPLGVAVSGLQ